MQTQCPKCHKIIDVPEIYNQKSIKCENCKATFKAEQYRPLPSLSEKPQSQPDAEPKSFYNKHAENKFNFLHSFSIIIIVYSVFFILLEALKPPYTPDGEKETFKLLSYIPIAILVFGFAEILKFQKMIFYEVQKKQKDEPKSI